MGPRFESVKVHQWPVGQVVKTEASHAFNIGSNPVRVTRNAFGLRYQIRDNKEEIRVERKGNVKGVSV